MKSSTMWHKCVVLVLTICQLTNLVQCRNVNDNGDRDYRLKKYDNSSELDDDSSRENSTNVRKLFRDEEQRIWTRYTWLMELYDHHKWLEKHYSNVSTNCYNHMDTYLKALRRGDEWAVKMSDASGRYNGQFFFGNNFWLGSRKMCSEMQLEYEDQMMNEHRMQATSPFSLDFSVGRLNLMIENYTSQARTILVGECLPSSCSSDDIFAILKSSTGELEMRGKNEFATQHKNETFFINDGSIKIDILSVRSVPGDYDVWEDPVFYIMGGASILVIILIIIGSLYEYCVNRSEKRCSKFAEYEYQNNNYANFHRNEANRSNEVVQDNNCANESQSSRLDPNAANNGSTTKIITEKKKSKGLFSEILMSFSVLSNAEKIMKTEDSGEDTVTCIHGLRFLSLLWVIMVHTYLQLFTVADNKTLRIITEKNFFYQTVGNASYSVDTFFFISGFLLTFLYFKTAEAKSNKASKCSEKQTVILEPINKDSTKHAYSNAVVPQSNGHQQAQTNGHQLNHPQTSNGHHTGPIFTRRTCVKDMKDGISELSVLLLYRVIRLTPAYIFVIGLNRFATKYSNINGVFDPTLFDDHNCALYWWRNVLYMNNFFTHTEMCMTWTWYLANDTQFYIVGVILLLIAKRYFKISLSILMVLMSSSWLITGYISLANDYRAKIQQPFEMFDLLYDKPWSRIGPYFIGMMTGWYIFRVKCRVSLPVWLSTISWLSTVCIMFSLIYGMKDGILAEWPTAFYVSIGHTAWGVAVAWIVLFCLSPQGKLLDKVLSYRGMLPLSRLTYCAYLVHPTLMMICVHQIDGPVHLHNGIVLVIYAGISVMSFLLSFAISLGLEAPVVRLLKIGMRRK